MVVTLVLSAALVLLVAIYLHHQTVRPKNYPPGPTWLPFVGNIFFINKRLREERYQHEVFNSLSKLYKTPVLGMKLGKELTVIVSSSQLVREVLIREEFEGRPKSFFFKLRTMGKIQGITFADGKLWHEHRSFAVRHLRKSGYGRQFMEQDILKELSDLRLQLKQNMNNQKICLKSYLSKRILNSLWILIAGTKLTHSLSYINKLLQFMEQRKRLFDMTGGKLNHMPWLRFVAPKQSGYSLITELNTSLKDFFTDIIKQHEESHRCDDIRDLIDAYLHHMHNEKEPEERKKSFTEEQLIAICLDFFIAGSQTTSSSLEFAFLLMILYPDIQKKVRDEIWSIVGTERLPTLNDRSNLPYVEAVLTESRRFCTVAPIIGPRRVLRETTLGGYLIPEDTTVLLNVHTLHMDQNHWKDPHVFRPERFLDENGAVRSDDSTIPFGLGRRRCLGEVFARSCIFLFFTGLLQHFQMLPDDEHHLPSIEPVPGIIMSPQPYNVRLISIHDKHNGA